MLFKRSLAALAAATLLGSAVAAPAAAQPAGTPPVPAAAGAQPHLTRRNSGKLFDHLAERLAAARPGDRETYDVIVRVHESAHVQSLSADLGVQPRTTWTRAIRGFSARVTREQLQRLQQHPLVQTIEENIRVTADMETAAYWSGARQAAREFGVSGDADGNPRSYSRDDVVVAVIDTGIDARHADLAGKVIGWFDVVNGIPLPYDDQGHGTHVGSIIAGTGAASGRRYAGVAPGAALVGVKVLDYMGSGTMESVISGVEWVIANKDRFRIRVANMSLGGGTCSDGTDALSSAVSRAVDAGIAFVVAAGNSGPGACTVGAPAAAEKAITVGAAYDPGEKGWAIAEFSSRGPTADGRIKPDIVTPGVNIMAAKANSKNQYVAHSGTSMATPFMAGILVLMLDANPNLTVEALKGILYDPANVKDFGLPGKDPEYGYGIALAYNDVVAAGGYRSSGWTDRLHHEFRAGDLGYDGARQRYTFRVTDTARPLALSMVVPDWQPVKLGLGLPAFRMELFDPAGRSVALSKGASRQEAILYWPPRRGTYTLEVRALVGNGPYHLDASYR